jgi:hypothetical protein
MDVHLVFIEIGGGFGQVRVLARHVREELFDADRQRLQLRLFDQHGHSGLIFPPCVEIKNALTGLADRVGGDVFAGVNVKFESGGHTMSIPKKTAMNATC